MGGVARRVCCFACRHNPCFEQSNKTRFWGRGGGGGTDAGGGEREGKVGTGNSGDGGARPLFVSRLLHFWTPAILWRDRLHEDPTRPHRSSS